MNATYVPVIRRWCVIATLSLGATWACEASPKTADPPHTTAAVPASSVATSTTVRVEAGFRSRQRLSEHFAKHGAEFGQVSRDEYLRLAQTLRDAPVGDNILEIRRDDGTVSRFDRKNGAFLAFDADGTIRTFFRPNDGEAYFQRQARRRSDR